MALDDELVGGASAITETGLIVGVTQPQITGWIYRNGFVEFLSATTNDLSANAVNEAAVVVGEVGPRDTARVFLFDEGMRDLQAVLSTDYGRGRDISNSGVVVGTIRNSQEEFIAYHFDTATQVLTRIPFASSLGDNYVNSEAVAVTEDGNFAVGLAHETGWINPRGFLYDHSSGETTDLGRNILPRAVNNNGIMAGSEWLFGGSGDMVTYNIATHTTQRHGPANLLVGGMNDNGDVVGSGGNSPAAFLYRPGHGVVDLNSQIPQGTGWNLVSAEDITNDGRIVGNAIFTDPATAQSRGRPFLLYQ